MNKNTIITVLIIASIIGGGRAVLADSASLLISPIVYKSVAGETFSAAVQINPAGHKVCLVKGTVNLENLTCQDITVASGLVGQSAVSCVDRNFIIGIPNCALAVMDLLDLSVIGTQVGQASVSFSGLEIYGDGDSVPAVSQRGVYTVGNGSVAETGLKLFDIALVVQNTVLDKASDLVAGTWLTNFGAVTTPVNMAYRIVDVGGRVVYSDNNAVTVETQQMVTKEFTNLTLGSGKYTLILATTYGDNVRDEFKQVFEVRGAPIQSKATALWVWIVLGLVVVGQSGCIIFLFLKRKTSTPHEAANQSAKNELPLP